MPQLPLQDSCNCSRSPTNLCAIAFRGFRGLGSRNELGFGAWSCGFGYVGLQVWFGFGDEGLRLRRKKWLKGNESCGARDMLRTV